VTAVLTVVVTNDLVGSVWPVPTSYGMLPGRAGLRAAVDGIHAAAPGPVVWLDAGDLAGWSPLVELRGRAEAYRELAGLGIAAAACGNHELDGGVAALPEWQRLSGIRLLCANAEVGLPATHLIDTPAGALGVLGLTTPGLGHIPGMPDAVVPTRALVAPLVAALRRAGARWVVALLHDGPRFTRADDGVRVDTAPIAELAGDWADLVDAIVGGHTLARHVGTAGARTPFVQPWAFGAELGMLRLSPEREASVETVLVPAPGARTAELPPEAAAVVGHVDRPLRAGFDDDSLVAWMAAGLAAATGADAALMPSFPLATQPAIDGIMAALAAGPATELDVLRLWPWSDDGILVVETAPGFGPRVEAALCDASAWWALHPVRDVLHVAREDAVTLAIPAVAEGMLADLLPADAIVRRTRVAVGVRAALRAALGRARDAG
jgi:hypothetical protein